MTQTRRSFLAALPAVGLLPGLFRKKAVPVIEGSGIGPSIWPSWTAASPTDHKLVALVPPRRSPELAVGLHVVRLPGGFLYFDYSLDRKEYLCANSRWADLYERGRVLRVGARTFSKRGKTTVCTVDEGRCYG